MGVGYSVSPLHRITYLDTSAMTTRPAVKGSDSIVDSVAELVGAKVCEGNTRFYSPTVGRHVHCTRKKDSGTSAPASGVASRHTGTMNALLRAIMWVR
jgi:hypothetical protein